MVVIVVRCDACGGAVAYDAQHEHARCLFCAAVALRPEPLDAAPESAPAVLPFAVDAAHAMTAFRRWTHASWWRPAELREAAATMQPLWIPAWRVRSEVELHWTGLERAPTRSGKRPRFGVDQGAAEVMVPASLGLTQAELVALQPFDGALRDPVPSDAGIARELPNVTAKAARARAIRLLTRERLAHVGAREHVSAAGGTVRLHEVQIELHGLPVWVGSFRYRDRPWRFVVNGSTARVVGRAPIDRVKLAITLLLALVVVLAWAWWHDRRPPPDDPEPQAHARDAAGC